MMMKRSMLSIILISLIAQANADSQMFWIGPVKINEIYVGDGGNGLVEINIDQSSIDESPCEKNDIFPFENFAFPGAGLWEDRMLAMLLAGSSQGVGIMVGIRCLYFFGGPPEGILTPRLDAVRLVK